MTGRTSTCHLLALGAVTLWAFAYVFTRVALQHFAAYDLGFLRNLFTSLFFASVLCVRGAGLPPLRDLPIFFLSGFLGFGLYMILFNLGLETINAATSSVLSATSPLFTAVLAALFFSEKLPRGAWLALALAFGGTALLTLWNGTLSLNQGIFWGLGAAFSMSCYNVIQRRCSRRYSSLQITGYSFVAGTLSTIFLLPGALGEFTAAPPMYKGLVFLLSAIGGSAYFLWANGIARAPRTSTVVNYMFLCPLLTLVFGYLIIEEFPHAGVLIGGGIVLCALALFNHSVRKARE